MTTLRGIRPAAAIRLSSRSCSQSCKVQINGARSYSAYAGFDLASWLRDGNAKDNKRMQYSTASSTATATSTGEMKRASTTEIIQDAPLSTALFFPGQGTQRVGMTSPWLDAFPSTTKHFLDETDSILGTSLSGIITYGPNSTLTATENAQPAIMATSILILRILEQEFGFKLSWHVDVTLGHSLGEFAALVAAGYLSYADALLMVRKRAEIMAECTRSAQSGPDGAAHGMVAVICEDGHLEDMISATHSFLYPNSTAGDDYTEPKYVASESSDTDKSTVSIANINSRNQIVLSGSLPRISALLVHLRHFTGHDPRAVRLNADSAFHNPIMAPAAEYMRTALSSTSPSDASNPTVIYPPNLPCISNVSALPFSSAQSVIDLLSRQATETVRWWDSIRYLDQVRGVKRWIGLGPGKVGRNLVGKEVGRVGRMRKGGGVWAVTGPEDMEALMEAIEEVEREDVESDGDGRE